MTSRRCPRCEREVEQLAAAYELTPSADVVRIGGICLGCVAELRWREHRQVVAMRVTRTSERALELAAM